MFDWSSLLAYFKAKANADAAAKREPEVSAGTSTDTGAVAVGGSGSMEPDRVALERMMVMDPGAFSYGLTPMTRDSSIDRPQRFPRSLDSLGSSASLGSLDSLGGDGRQAGGYTQAAVMADTGRPIRSASAVPQSNLPVVRTQMAFDQPYFNRRQTRQLQSMQRMNENRYMAAMGRLRVPAPGRRSI